MTRPVRDRPPALISGPVSAHVFDVGNTRLFVFGDEHFAFDNLCEPCDSRNDCKSIVRFIRGLVEDARQGGESEVLDVYMELPYVVRDGPGRRKWLKTLDEVMGRDPSRVFPSRSRASAQSKRVPSKPMWPFWGGSRSRTTNDNNNTDAMVARVLGDSPKYIGVFSQLYREFRDDFYREDGNNDDKATRNVRFHYCDARHEEHVQRILPFIDPARFHRYVRTSDQLREVLNAFLFSRDFPAEIRRIFGTREAARLLSWDGKHSNDNSSINMHKVAKQFHSLPEGPIKAAAKRYLDDRIEDAVSVARLDLNFDEGPHILAAAAEAHASVTSTEKRAAMGPKAEDLAWLWRFRLAHGQYYAAFFPEVIRFSTHLLIMDAYLLCRMLRFSFPSSKDRRRRTAVVYAGDAHSEYYVSFFKDYLGVSPSVCSKLGPPPDRATRSTDRCVRMESVRKTQCATLGSRPANIASAPKASI